MPIPASLSKMVLLEAVKLDRTFPQVEFIMAQLEKRYDKDRPCHYRVLCLETGRCPKEISCDN